MALQLHSDFEITPRGQYFPITADGLIHNPCDATEIQPPWSGAIRDICAKFSADIAELHSVYVRGSVPLGNAICDISDVDCIAL